MDATELLALLLSSFDLYKTVPMAIESISTPTADESMIALESSLPRSTPFVVRARKNKSAPKKNCANPTNSTRNPRTAPAQWPLKTEVIANAVRMKAKNVRCSANTVRYSPALRVFCGDTASPSLVPTGSTRHPGASGRSSIPLFVTQFRDDIISRFSFHSRAG